MHSSPTSASVDLLGTVDILHRYLEKTLCEEIFDEVRAIHETVRAGDRPVRLVGVRAEQLVDPAGLDQALWDDRDDWRQAETVMDAAIERFGRGAVTPARLLGHRADERPRLGQRD